MNDRFEVIFEYNGQPFSIEVEGNQQIEGAWHRALAHFEIRPQDAENLGLFKDGNQIDRNQSFKDAGIQPGERLRIQPIVQRTGGSRV